MSDQMPRTPSVNFTLGTDTPPRLKDEVVIGKRILAYIIDICILGMTGFALTLLNFMSLGLLSPLIALTLFLLPLAYHSYLISSPAQATIGQRVMNIKQINATTGDRMSWLQAIVQVALFYMTLGMTGGLLLIWCLFDNKGRCLHDILSNTHVIRAD